MSSNKSKVQGEGDYDAARRYRQRTEAFVANNDVTAKAHKAEPANVAEARELIDAEQRGKARAKKKRRAN